MHILERSARARFQPGERPSSTSPPPWVETFQHALWARTTFDRIEKFFHGAFATLVYLSTCCTHEEVFFRRMSFATTLLARQSLPAPSIIVSNISTMGTRFRSSTTIVSISVTIVLLPGAVILVRFFSVWCSRHANSTTIHIFIGSS